MSTISTKTPRAATPPVWGAVRDGATFGGLAAAWFAIFGNWAGVAVTQHSGDAAVGELTNQTVQAVSPLVVGTLVSIFTGGVQYVAKKIRDRINRP